MHQHGGMARAPALDPMRMLRNIEPSGQASKLDTSKRGFWPPLRDRNLQGRLFGMVRLDSGSAREMHLPGDQMLPVLTETLESSPIATIIWRLSHSPKEQCASCRWAYCTGSS